MSANSFGHLFRIHTFGESHGKALGVVIDGCPAGTDFSERRLQAWLDRRRPGQTLTSPRMETDQAKILSGVYESKTLGTPIAIIVENHDVKSTQYLAGQPNRPGHADDLWLQKFKHADPRGGGRASGRETVARVIAGAVAEMFVQQVYPQVKVIGFASQIGPLQLEPTDLEKIDLSNDFPSDPFLARFPSHDQAERLTQLLSAARDAHDSVGGKIEIWIENLPSGLGQPVFRKLKSDLAQAYLSVGATHATEIGEGSDAEYGSEFHSDARGKVYGGIRGGISTGDRITSHIGIKPTSSIGDFAKQGRHDPCIIPRAIPVLEAMTWLVLAEHVLWKRLDHLLPS